MPATPEIHDAVQPPAPGVSAWLPAVSASALPARFVSPFAPRGPHPLARQSAEELQDGLRRGTLAGGLSFDAPGGGKMFGVLVVAHPSGQVGYLRGFSGMLGGKWHLEGFVPPLFDEAALARVWPAGEVELDALNRRHEALATGPEPVAIRGELAALAARHEAELAALATRHAARRQRRHDERLLARGLPEPERGPALHALDQHSRADKAERRRLLAANERARAALCAKLLEIDAERVALERFRTERSHQLWEEVNDTYVVTNALGERRRLRQLFAPGVPPGGAGD
ncbi:MAG: RluA family pseudouridine synthase, partial [Deltaproteobacteria bacterium]|nr:RluA family pseudouridine synthase [Deltaproteobacteria bacterium]